MFTSLKANILFHSLLKRPKIEKAYAMVASEDSWYETICKVHTSLARIQKLPHEVLTLTSHDGLKLQGIYYPAEGGSNLTVICAHGYTSHAEREWAFPGLFYHSLGYNVLIPYQRAHGPSQGKYITFGALEHLDMMGWIDRVNQMTPNGKIVLHGLSMGGGIVLFMADKELPNVACLIADAPSESIEGFFRRISAQVFKAEGARVCAAIQKKYERLFGTDLTAFDVRKTVSGSKYPILLAAGSNEGREAAFAELEALCPKKTVTVILDGCNHGNGMYKQTEAFQGAIRAFLTDHLR